MADTIVRNVFVISDLHLGGVYGQTTSRNSRGFRICTHVPELSAFVNALAQNSTGSPKIELIINGDMVDFLAEREAAPPYWVPFTLDSQTACAKLEAIADRDRPFFDALGNLLDKGHRLVVLTGNHDTELALPPVRRKLREILRVQAHHDYEFISNGEAYAVGEALIEHGNRYDSWNVVNYDALRRISSLMSRRQTIPKEYAFDPPAGSKMVAWVINEIKEDYKFIDLLKPENDVAVPILLALEPGYRQILATVAKLAIQARQHGVEKDNAALPSIGSDIASADSSDASFGSDISTYSETGLSDASQSDGEDAALRETLKSVVGGDTDQFLQSLAPAGAEPSADIGSDISTANIIDRTLGMASLFTAHDDQDVSRRLPALLKALRALQPDRSFDRDFETAPGYLNAANELIDGGFRYVIFGHTHLAKHIELKRPGCFYLNSGTWADLMQLPPEIVSGEPAAAMTRLQEIVQAIATGMLDRWIRFKPTYIRLDLDAADRIVRADLCDYDGEVAVGQSAGQVKK